MTATSAGSQRFFGTHYSSIEAGPFGCTLSRATIPLRELPEHQHADGHVILAIDEGYLSRALDEPGTGFDLIYSPPGTIHRDCFLEPGGRFLSVDVPTALAPVVSAPVPLRGGAATMLGGRLLGTCITGGDDAALVIEDYLLSILCAAQRDERTVREPS